jgi:hypothetical protein
MGWIIDLSERGGEVRRFEEGLKKAKHGLSEAFEIWEDMKEQFSERDDRYDERGSYGERYNMRDGYYGREYDDMHERRRRNSMGRYY